MSKRSKELILSFLEEIIRVLEATNDSQFEALVSGKAKLELNIVQVDKENAGNKNNVLPTDFEKKASETLHGFSSRDEGGRYLEALCTTKQDFIRIARYLDLPVQKKETIKQIKDKIIESTIGFRVRSAAVQGTLKEPS